MAQVGNKGAIGCSLTVHASTVCLVVSHLASGTSAVEARNLEYGTLTSRITFDRHAHHPSQAASHGLGAVGGEGSADAEGGELERACESLSAHDFVVWIRATHGALPHRAPSPRCTAEPVHHV